MGRFSDIIEQSDFPVSPDTSKDPDRFAADKDLANQTGLPVDYVERNRNEAEQIKRQNVDYSKYADTELGGSLTDPEFSNLAQDDLDNLSYLERTFKGLGTTIAESVKQGVKGVALSLHESGPPTPLTAIGVYGDDPFVTDILDKRYGEGFLESVKQAGSDVMIESIQQNEEDIKAATPEGLDVLQKGIRSGIQSLAQMAPGLAASLATRSSAPMLTMAGVQSYGDSYATARAKGLSPEESGRYAMVDAGIEVATEKLPADKLLKITGEFGNQTLKQVVRFLVTEGATEQVATFLQSMNAWHQGLDEELDAATDASEIARIQGERQAVTLISTIVAGGAQSGVAAGVGYAANKLDKNQPLKDLKATAEQSNLKRRSPEQFRQFLQAVDPLANIFIPASALEGVTITPDNPTMKLVASQLPQARALGGDVVVPVADVMTDIPQDVFDAVYPYMRVDADGVAEIEDRPDMKALIEEVNRDADNQKQAKAFRDNLTGMLTGTARVNPDEAKKYSAMVSARIETLAIDKGMTFDEAVQKYVGDLKVVGPDVAVGDGAIMDQAKAEGYNGAIASEAAEWVAAKDKGLDMSQAARMQRAAEQGFDTGKVWYRGQLKPFEEDKIKNITWFTDSPEYADAYAISPTMKEAFSGENIIQVYLNKDKRFDFGYRTLKTDVKKSDVYERVQGGILEAYDRGLIDKDKAISLHDHVSELIKNSGNEYKKVYEWYNEDPEIFRIIKESGFDHVTTKEGFADSYNAIGMLYPERIRSVNAAFDPAQKESSNLLAQSYTPEEIDFLQSQFVSGAEQLQIEDQADFATAEELIDNGAKVTPDGRVLVFHRTSKENANSIKKTGKMSGKENRLFFSTVRDGQNAGYGEAVVELLIPIKNLQLDDVFGDEAHLSLLTKKAGDRVDVSKYILDSTPKQPKVMAQPAKQTETEAFKKWFGDSKVVDENGKPLVVYHGSDSKFNTFEMGRKSSRGVMLSSYDVESHAAFFSPSEDDAGSYGGVVRPFYLSVQNPLVSPDTLAISSRMSPDEKTAVAKVYDDVEYILAPAIYEDGGTRYIDTDNGISRSEVDADGNWIRKVFIDNELDWSFLDNQEIVARIKERGYDGVRITEPNDSSGYSWAVFSPTQIKSATGNRGTFDPNDPSILNQKERGLISISDKEIVIKLTEASNRSTFIHEAGHLFLEIESRIAAKDGISDSQRKMLEWLGVDSFDQIKVEHHEKFARGFEAYAMEGRAPSADLVEVFRSFARWLKKVYSSMKSLNVELNDDIRQFFDRMLAADQAIKDAERLNQYSALFKDAKTAGMTEAEYADYQAHLARANSRGNESLQSKLLKELTRQTEKWWKESLAAERDKAMESLGEQPIYRATRFLSGDLKVEGYDNPKLDTEAVKSILGIEPVERVIVKKPKEPAPLVDPRLKRDVYRGHLESMVNRDLLSVKEGNLALVVDNTPQGESDARGSVKMKRTSSVNPQWFQDFNKESPSPVSVDQARAIVKKAIAGDRLGVNQARFIIAALDEITGKREEYADTLKRQRDAVREQRKYMAEMYPVPAEYADFSDIEKAGEVYRDSEYILDLDYLDRSMSELAYAAIGVGVPEDTVMGIIDANTTIAAIEQIQKLYKEKTDERAESLAGSDQAAAEEVEGKPAQKEQSRISKFRGLTRKGGIHPDEVAALFDFASGHELVMQIADSPTLKQAAAAAAQAAMIEQHGDILNDGTLQQEADISAHNEERGKLILSELRALNRKTGTDTINRDALKFSAKEVIGRSVLKDIHPGKYRTAEVRSAREAATALAKKNYKAAAAAKLKQAANFYLYREALDAKRKEQSWRRYLKSVQDRKYSTKEVNPDYVRQMKMLAAVYDFRKSGNPSELLGVAQWLKAQQEVKDADYAPQILDTNLSTALEAAAKGDTVTVKHYRDMTMDELQGVYDMVKHLRWVGGQMSENEKAKRVAEYERVGESIQANSKKGKIEQPRQTGGKVQAIKEGVSQYKADYFPLPDFIERLDGFQSFGPAFNLIYDKVIDSSNVELKLRREAATKATEIFKEFGSSDFAPGKASVTITTEAGEKLTLDRRGRIMMALYHGSQYSRDVMMQGDNLTLNDINSMLSHLTNKELDLVEAVWALNESFWPQVAEVSRKMTGIVPPKREVVPFAVNGRVMPGGYMRLFYMYDTRDSHVAVSSDEGKITRTGDRLAKQTKHGGRMEVVGSGGRKVQFEVSNIFKALDETIHDIAFAETARDSMAALTSKQVSSAIVNYHGKDVYESMLASLSGVIAGNQSSGGWFNNMMRHFRTAQTYAMLGYSIRNLVQQPASLPNVWGYVGFMETNAELIRMWAGGHWKQNIEFVQSKSEFMKNRTALVNRDTAEIMGSISGNVMSSRLKRHAFDLQTMADGFVGYPAWMAQYKKSLAEFESDPMEVREKKAIKAADEAVARTIGSGLMKDMSPMLQGGGKLSKQIGPEMLKSLTFMGSYMATVGRLIARANANRDFKTVGGVSKYSREMFFYLVAPALMSALLTGAVPDDDDDEGWAEWTAKTVGKYGLSTVFGLRDIVQVASGYGVQNSYGRALEQMWRSVDIAADVAAGEKEADLETSAKMLRASSGYFTIPFAYQAARTMEYIDSQQDGNEGDFNIYKALVVGKERD